MSVKKIFTNKIIYLYSFLLILIFITSCTGVLYFIEDLISFLYANERQAVRNRVAVRRFKDELHAIKKYDASSARIKILI